MRPSVVATYGVDDRSEVYGGGHVGFDLIRYRFRVTRVVRVSSAGSSLKRGTIAAAAVISIP